MSSDPRVQHKPRLPKSYTPEQLTFLRSHLPEFERRSQGSIRGDAKKFALLRAADFIHRFGLPEDFGGDDSENRFREQIYNWFKNTVGRTRRKLEGRPRSAKKAAEKAAAAAASAHHEVDVTDPTWASPQPTIIPYSHTVTVAVPEADVESPGYSVSSIAPPPTPSSISATISPAPVSQPTQVPLPPPQPQHQHSQHQHHVHDHTQEQHLQQPISHQNQQAQPQAHQPQPQSQSQPQRHRLKQHSSNGPSPIEVSVHPATLCEAFLTPSFDTASLSTMIQTSILSKPSPTPLNPVVDALFEAISSADATPQSPRSSGVQTLLRRYIEAAEYFPHSVVHAGVCGPNAGARALQMRIRKQSVWIPSTPSALPVSQSIVHPQTQFGYGSSFASSSSQVSSNHVNTPFGSSFGSTPGGNAQSAAGVAAFNSRASYSSNATSTSFGTASFNMNGYPQSNGATNGNLSHAHQGYQPTHHNHSASQYATHGSNHGHIASTPPISSQGLMSPHSMQAHLSSPMQSHSSSQSHAAPLLPHNPGARIAQGSVAHQMGHPSGIQQTVNPALPLNQAQSQSQSQSQAHQTPQHHAQGTLHHQGASVAAPPSAPASSLSNEFQRIAADRQRRKDYILWAKIHAAALEIGVMSSCVSARLPEASDDAMMLDRDDAMGTDAAYGDPAYHAGSPSRYPDGAMYPSTHAASQHVSYPTPTSTSSYPTPSYGAGSPSSSPSTPYGNTSPAVAYLAACSYASARAFSEGFVADAVWGEDEVEWAAGVCVLRALIETAGGCNPAHGSAGTQRGSNNNSNGNGNGNNNNNNGVGAAAGAGAGAGGGHRAVGGVERGVTLGARQRERQEYDELLRAYEGKWKEIRDEARQALVVDVLLEAREAMARLDAELEADSHHVQAGNLDGDGGRA